MLNHLIADRKAFLILRELIVSFEQLLLPCLYCKIGLAKCNNFLSRVSILHNQIAGIPRKHNITDIFMRCTSLYDFVDVNKIAGRVYSTILTGNFCLFNYAREVSPLGVSQNALQITRIPKFFTIFRIVLNILKSLLAVCSDFSIFISSSK